MALLIYQTVDFIPAQTAGPQNTVPGWPGNEETLSPKSFARPFPVYDQQYVAHLNFEVPSPAFPNGWQGGLEADVVLAKPNPSATALFDVSLFQGNVPTPFTYQWWEWQYNYRFARPFPAAAQQYDAMPWQGDVPSPKSPEGWQGYQFDIKFAVPFPTTDQQFLTHLDTRIPTKFFGEGWRNLQYDYAFIPPFPVASQRFQDSWRLDGKSTTFFVNGSQNVWDWQFAKPFPLVDQQHVAHLDFQVPSPLRPNGWIGLLYDYAFAKPFPIESQIFSVWDLYGSVPVYYPPGAGKRRDFPFAGYPQPARDVEPRKPIKPVRPVWDKEPEKPQAPGPIPMPPAGIFVRAADHAPRLDAFKLPSFDKLVPPDHQSLAERMRHAMDMSDMIAVLRAAGLIPGDDEGHA